MNVVALSTYVAHNTPGVLGIRRKHGHSKKLIFDSVSKSQEAYLELKTLGTFLPITEGMYFTAILSQMLHILFLTMVGIT